MHKILFLNGCILMMLGSGLGFPYWFRLIKLPDGGEGFRVAHSAITMGGIAIVALSSGVDLIALSPTLKAIFVVGILCTGYGFGVSTTTYAFTGRRGLVWKNGLDAVVFTFMCCGALGGTVAGALLLLGVFRALTG